MKKAKCLMVLVLTLIMVFTGCGSKTNKTANEDNSNGSTEEKKSLTIGMSFQEMDNPYFVTMHEAFEDAAKEIGATTYVTDASHDVNKQISDVEDMIEQGTNILLINPTDSVGIESAVVEAKEAGVIVVAIDAQANGPIDSFAGSKNKEAGYLAGKQMAEDLGEKGKVGIINGIPVVPILERVEGFKEAMAEYPDIEIVDNQNGEQERDKCMTVTENMMQANPELDAIFSVNDGGALGCLAAIESSKKDIKLYSVDGHPEAVEAILNGDIFKATVAQYPRDQIRVGLGIALAKYWGANVPEVMPIDVTLLTKDNAEGFSW
ncbi:LacI family transcriptional regulator [Vallitalea longa]|uniref:LacI family transcriptional regulator n=1 Tax=Vallitalea longa TaxID=2936439 RepID=A0A9W5YCD7_9FIRM|nr:ABC transporter substrate-binding protein [Vallitalea longa]GKX30897.1 LacI family transcriptional regulator [Vallitalea longa]